MCWHAAWLWPCGSRAGALFHQMVRASMTMMRRFGTWFSLSEDFHPQTSSHFHQLSSILFPNRIFNPLHARTELTQEIVSHGPLCVFTAPIHTKPPSRASKTLHETSREYHRNTNQPNSYGVSSWKSLPFTLHSPHKQNFKSIDHLRAKYPAS
jgi:hypothetical protein